MTYYVNPNIRDTQRLFPEQGRGQYLRFDMNENPEGLPEEFVRSVLAEITPEFLATYPESDAFLKKFASFLGVETDQVMATNGSDMGIRYLLETFGEPGKKVITVSPSFEMYRINCSLLGLTHHPVEYNEDLTIDEEKILDAINEDTGIVVLLNPNNPIGDTYSEDTFARIADKAEQYNALVFVDEAYHYFYEGTLLSSALQRDNVIVLRTFSKLFSLAACRLGVVIGNRELIRLVRNAKLTFDVNAVALLFGERILERPDMIKELIAREKEGKAWFCNELENAGYSYIACKGNYVLVKTHSTPTELEQRLREDYRILIHSFGHVLLRDYIRVSTGSKGAMKKLTKAFFVADQGEKR